MVAIDGGTATGKGRLIDELSQLLRIKGVPVVRISTGSLYRAVAYTALDYARIKVAAKRTKSVAQVHQEALEIVRQLDAAKLAEIARPWQIQMHGGVVWMDGRPALVEEELKAPSVGTGASVVSRHLPVRELVNAATLQQANEFDGFVLIDGRDIGTVVVPEAPLKLLLTVSPEVAAQRSTEHTMEEVIARDEADRNREHGALPHPDRVRESIVVLPTDEHTPESVRDHVYGLMRGVWPELPPLSQETEQLPNSR